MLVYVLEGNFACCPMSPVCEVHSKSSANSWVLQVLQIVSECPESSPLQAMKSQAEQLFIIQTPADDLPKDIPDLGTLGNYLLTRSVWAALLTP